MSNYPTKADIKNVSLIDTSSFVLKLNLTDLKTRVDELDIDELVHVPVDLSKLSDEVKNDNGKKAVFNKLVEKVNNINTKVFVLTRTKQN